MASFDRTFRATLATCLLVFSAFGSPQVRAEEGDYGFWQTLTNLVWPAAADNKVTATQRTGYYPLLSNPRNFNDGFRAGDYYAWQTVQAAPETGAVCGNGSPFKFFVSRVPHTRNTLVFIEGGGACWDYDSCSGRGGVLGASNPNGIPDDYMNILANPATVFVSPMVARVHPYDRIKTQSWNIVYVPYCTGDIHAGDRVAVYPDQAQGQPSLIWHHNGLRNLRAVASWMKDSLPRPTQLLTAGYSAGGAGSLFNYHPLRRDLAPTRGFLLNDSGPIFPTPRDGDSRQYPSQPQMAVVRKAWGLDQPAGPLDYLGSDLPAFDRNELGSLYTALSRRYPADRMGHTHFWQDMVYSDYSYGRAQQDVIDAPDRITRNGLLMAHWRTDTERLRTRLDSLDNFGGYFPQYRALTGSHCATVVDFQNADIQAEGLELKHFLDNLLEGRGKVLDASEASDQADHAKPGNWLYTLINLFAGL